jgi:phage shock protein E
MKARKLILMSLFLLSLIGIGQAQVKTEVTSVEVNTLLQKKDKWVVLDVRTAGEFQEGHIKGAINMDVHQPNALENIDKLDRNANYIVYCRTKNRSGIVVNHMIEAGFKVVYQMMDGYVGWSYNNLPIEK